MPELPEVETIARGLASRVTGDVIESVWLGAKPEMGVALHRTFQEAGLPMPTMRMEVLLGNSADFTLWIYDVLCSLRPQIERNSTSLEVLGGLRQLAAASGHQTVHAVRDSPGGKPSQTLAGAALREEFLVALQMSHRLVEMTESRLRLGRPRQRPGSKETDALADGEDDVKMGQGPGIVAHQGVRLTEQEMADRGEDVVRGAFGRRVWPGR